MLIDGGLPVVEALETNDFARVSGMRKALALGITRQDLADGGPSDVCTVVGDNSEADFGAIRWW